MADGKFLRHEPCPKCGSKDNLARYEDHGFCFGCGYYEGTGGVEAERPILDNINFVYGEFMPLMKRQISEETCRKFDYRVGVYRQRDGLMSPVQIANYRLDGKVVGQKIRFPSKDFKYIGDGTQPPLFGQHLWGNGGKMIVVTEGEIDCMTVSQVQGNKYPVVSVPNGAQGARKALQRELEWLERFDSVILMFDMDEPGQEAAKLCAEIFTPGKAKIAHLSMKDPNELLLAGKGEEIIRAVWNAKEYRPDGIIAGPDSWDYFMKKRNAVSIPYPWEPLNKLTYGLRKHELVTVTAGTGIGKSTFCRELAYHLVKAGQKVGYIALEESVGKTAESFISLELNIPLHTSKTPVSDAVLQEAWKQVFDNSRFFLYDHWGSTDIDNLISKMRYLVRSCGVDWLFLDHISIVVSGIADGDERRMIDNIMTRLRTFVENVDCGLIIVSHLKRTDEKTSHEEGGRVRLSHLRGSGAIAQLSDIAIGLERDQQDAEEANVVAVRVLKNRYSGDTGVACEMYYDKQTGRLYVRESEQVLFTQAATEDGSIDY